MFASLKKLFSQEEEVIEEVFPRYNAEEIENYKKMYPDISIETISIPEINNFKSYRVKKWKVRDGSSIKKGQILCEIDRGGMVMELESFVDGYVYFRRSPSELLNEGDFLCLILQKKPEKAT